MDNQNEWTVIWNTKQYGWGVTMSGEPAIEAEADALQIIVPVQNVDTSLEMFTISFEEKDSLNLVLAWDKTKVSVPLK